MKHRSIESVNLTPMIDIVFQMIIFFVFTLDLEREKFDTEKILIPDAPNAKEIVEFEPATVYPQVMRNGDIKLGTAMYSPGAFRNTIRMAVKRYGQEVPVMIYADGEAEHRHIKKVMDICSEEGLYKINIIGLIEKSGKEGGS
ncbi:biopolymer transporter ExbD [Kiritimatiellaeota bacterium B1221]|nr:biopolymer transporter ExbD [Kiritimatiellaeota bacterium B1221]